jgi:hypothetical protein
LPTDFEVQASAGVARGVVQVAKVLISALWRFHAHFAKVRVAGSNPVVRSKKVQVRALIDGALFA